MRNYRENCNKTLLGYVVIIFCQLWYFNWGDSSPLGPPGYAYDIAYNSNVEVERIFSLMQPQWSKQKERFLFDSVASILKLVYNFSDVACNKFNDIVKADSTLLKKVKETAKYSWAKSKD